MHCGESGGRTSSSNRFILSGEQTGSLYFPYTHYVHIEPYITHPGYLQVLFRTPIMMHIPPKI